MSITGSPQSSEHPSSSPRRWFVPALFFLAVTIPWAILYRGAVPAALFAPSLVLARNPVPPVAVPAASTTKAVDADDVELNRSASRPPVNESESEEATLERVFKAAAMPDNTVILTLLNEAWAAPGSALELFMESFRIGNGTQHLLNHLVIIAVDGKAYRRCLEIHPHCFALVTEGVDFSGYKQFMSQDYLKMMWRRLDFLRIVLEKGFSFIFSDVDIMWFRNPFLGFVPDGEVQIACDDYVGSPTDLRNSPNNGFNYVKANKRTVEFYKYWYSSKKRFPGHHEQNVLNFIKGDRFVRDLGVRIRFLSTEYFGGICQPSEDFNKVITFHVNCCIGLDRKLFDLKLMLDDWRKYMSLPPSLKTSQNHSWSIPNHCRMDFKSDNKLRHGL